MQPVLSKLLRYGQGALSSLARVRSHSLLKLLTRSSDTLQYCDRYDFSIVVSTHDPAIGRPLLFKGEYEENVISVLGQHLQPDTHFLDIGANIGYYSLFVARHAPQGRVLCFEPDLQNFRRLQASIAYNGFSDRVQAHNLAVSDEASTLVVSDLGNAANSGARFTGKSQAQLQAHIHGANPYFREVQAVRLDDFLADQRIDLIKIDIEGHEPYAFRGMEQILQRQRPTILAEFAPSNLRSLGNADPQRFLQEILDLGYAVSAITLQGNCLDFGQDSAALLSHHQQQKRHHTDLLLRPA